MDSTKFTRSRWGRPRFGGSSAMLLSASFLIGVLISASLGLLFVWLGDVERPPLAFVVMAIVTLPVAMTLGWAVLVDRSTLAGATDKPEDSIESAWYEKAASGAFGDVLMVGGLGTAGFTFLQLEAPVSLILLAVTLLAMLDFAARYLWLKRSAA